MSTSVGLLFAYWAFRRGTITPTIPVLPDIIYRASIVEVPRVDPRSLPAGMTEGVFGYD